MFSVADRSRLLVMQWAYDNLRYHQLFIHACVSRRTWMTVVMYLRCHQRLSVKESRPFFLFCSFVQFRNYILYERVGFHFSIKLCKIHIKTLSACRCIESARFPKTACNLLLLLYTRRIFFVLIVFFLHAFAYSNNIANTFYSYMGPGIPRKPFILLRLARGRTLPRRCPCFECLNAFII